MLTTVQKIVLRKVGQLVFLLLVCHGAFLVLEQLQAAKEEERPKPMVEMLGAALAPGSFFRLTKWEMTTLRVLFIVVPVGWALVQVGRQKASKSRGTVETYSRRRRRRMSR